MKLKQLKINSEIIFKGKRFTVITFRPPYVVLKGIADCETAEIKFEELIMNLSQEANVGELNGNANIKAYKEFPTALLPEKLSDIVDFRYGLIRPIIEFEKFKVDSFFEASELMEKFPEYFHDEKDISVINKTMLINRIAKAKSISQRAIQRHLADYKEGEKSCNGWGMMTLIPKTMARNRKDDQVLIINDPNKSEIVLDTLTVRLNTDQTQILKGVIEKEYLTLLKPTVANIIESVNIKCSKNDIELLRPITIRKIIERIDNRVKTKFRDGAREAQKYNDTTRGYTNEEALYPLHIVAIDHKLLDIDIIDENGIVIGRPWLTLGLDLFSRNVWATHVSFDAPSSDKVMKTILHGLFPKEEKEIYNLKNDWDIFGVPRIIQLDNGKDFRSAHVKRIINIVLQSDIRHRPPHTPSYGGAVERFFKTLDTQLIHRLEGTRKSNPKELGEYIPDEEAKLTLEDLKEIICRYIVDVYHFSVHKGLPGKVNTPAARYLDGIKMAGFPEYFSLEDKEAITMEMLPQDKKPYTRDGIRYHNIRYKSPECSDLIHDREVKYTIKYDSDDVSRIFVFHPAKSEYIEVPAVEPPAEELKGVSRRLFEALQKLLIKITDRKNKSIMGVNQLQESKENLEADIKKKYMKSRNVRKVAAKNGIEVTAAVPNGDHIDKQKEKKTKPLTLEQLLKKTKL